MLDKRTKLCVTCKQEVPISLFGNLSSSKDGLSNTCKYCRRTINKKWYYKDYVKTRQKRNKQAKERYSRDPEKHAKHARDNRRELRLEVLEIYGNKCNCCGESEETFLTIDHIHGDGNKHRREVGNNSSSVLQSIRKEGYPKDKYQVLCFNCNRSKYVLGKCTHIMKKHTYKRVGLDIDGVLADFGSSVIRRAKTLNLDKNFPKCKEEVTCWDMGENFSKIMKDAWLDEQFWLDLSPLRDNNLPFQPAAYITSRPIKTEITEQWLDNHGFPKAPVISVSRPEDKLAHVIDLNLDLFVDDLFTTVRMILEAGYNAVLYKAPYHRGHVEECEGLPTIEKLEEICLNYLGLLEKSATGKTQ